MPTFVWEGKTRSGETKKGTIEADSEAAAAARLRNEQITPLRVKRQGKGFSLKFGGGVPTKDLVVFTRQFGTMIDSGLPLVQCLDILATQTENKRLSKVLFEVKAQVESGSTFSDALARHPQVFDDLYVNLVGAGEVGGILDTILRRLGDYIEKSLKIVRQVKGALTYPIGVLIVAILVVIVMLWKVIPTFQAMFKEMKAGSLPAPTQLMLNMSQSFRDNGHWYALTAIAIAVGFTLFRRHPKGRRIWDRLILKAPVIGPVIRKTVVARFTRTLGTLLSSGVPILDAMEIVATTAGNKIVEEAIMYAREKISEGKDLATPLGQTGVFPPMVIQMVAVGEQTGAMDAMLQKVADFYEDEVDVAVAALSKSLEPIIMCFLAVVVGGLVIAMYLPVFEIAGNIKAN